MVRAKADLLVDALRKARGVVSRRPPLPVLNTVKLQAEDGKLILEATDLDVFWSGEVEAEVSQELLACVRPDLLLAPLQDLGEVEVELVREEKNLLLRTPKGKYRFETMDPELFPGPSRDEEMVPCGFEAAWVRCISWIPSRKDYRQALWGIWLEVWEERTCLVASDGHVLGVVPFPVKPEPAVSAIVPLEAFGLLTGKVQGYVGKSWIDLGSIKARLIEAEIPPWRSLWPWEWEEEARLIWTVEPEALKGALRRLVPMADRDAHKVVFDFVEQAMEARCEEYGTEARESLPGFVGMRTDLKIAFDGEYWLKVLASLPPETKEIKVRFWGPKEKTHITAVGDFRAEYLLMPLSPE